MKKGQILMVNDDEYSITAEDIQKIEDKMESYEKSNLKHIIASIGAALILIILMASFYGDIDIGEPVLVHEKIVDKRITYINDFLDHTNHYFIFTDNYCFDVPLNVYNQLDKGDLVNVSVRDGYGSLVYGEDMYLSE